MRVRGASPASVAYRVNWRSAETPSALEPEKIQLKVLWSGSESRISFQSSLERDQTLISYEAHDLDLEKIQENSKEVVETVRLGNLDGSAVEASKALKNLGQRLFSLVFPKEIRDRIRMSLAATLVLELDDGCVHLPWELAHDGRDFLCCRFSMGRLVRTGQASDFTRRPVPAKGVSILIVSDPCGNLPAADREGRQLYELYRSDERVTIEHLNQDVSPSAVKERLSDYDILHYSGHAEFKSESPDESGWILKGGQFTAKDLESHVSSGESTPLIIFNNACETGATGAWSGKREGWSYGLPNAFLLGGCTHYVGVLSQLLDISSQDFAQTFYRGVLAGLPVGRALRQSRLKLRRERGFSGLTWAQYVLYGDPDLGVFKPLPGSEDGDSTELEGVASIPGPAEEYRYIVSVDLGRYSAIVSSLEKRHGLGPKAVYSVQAQITDMLRTACDKAGTDYDACLADFTGDGAILSFTQAEQVDRFAEGLFEESAEWNKSAKSDEEYRCFRIGAFDGSVVVEEDGRITGAAVSSAVRLEQKGVTGEILASGGIYEGLTPERRENYGDVEQIPGKDHDEPFPAHRRHLMDPAPWEVTRSSTLPAGVKTGSGTASDVREGTSNLSVPVVGGAIAVVVALVLILSWFTPSKVGPPSDPVWGLYSQIRDGNFSLTENTLSESNSPKELEAYLALKKGDLEAAKSLLAETATGPKRSALSILIEAQTAWSEEKMDEAKNLIAKVGAHPKAKAWEKAEASRIAGRIAHAEGNSEEALRHYGTAGERSGGDYVIWLDRGILLEQSSDFDAALVAYDKALELSPDDNFIGTLRNKCAERGQRKTDDAWWTGVRESLDRLKDAVASGDAKDRKVDRWTSRPVGIAVLDFGNVGSPPPNLGEAEVLGLEIERQFFETDRWFVVERDRLDAVLQELEIGSSDLANSNYANQVGQFLAARGLLSGDIIRRGGEAKVNLRLIDTEKRVVAAWAQASMTSELEVSAKEIVSQIVDRLEKDFELRGRVVSATGEVLLNIGQAHGVRAGQSFDVYTKESDPLAAGSVKSLTPVAQLEIVDVDESSATCKVSNAEIDLEQGMRAVQAGTDGG